MERIERQEGETLELGGYTFGVAYCRDKKLVLFANNFCGETASDVEVAVKRFRRNLDEKQAKESNTGNTTR